MAEKNRKDIYAALGAVAGLGNALRFPALCADYGGAFLFVYAAMLAAVCFPLLCAELSLAKRGGRWWEAVMRAATVNSLAIALYYVTVSSRLGGECLPCDMKPASSVIVLGAIFALLAAGRRGLSLSGRVSVMSFLALFFCLAACAVILRGADAFKIFVPDFSVLARGGIWADALGQALLSLSLAAGVMPSFASTLPVGFSSRKIAAKIIAVNLCGCILASLATLPLADKIEGEGLAAAFTIFPQISRAITSNAVAARAIEGGIYGALCVVAVHSTCSLASPALYSLGDRYKKFFPAAFCILSALLTPLFSFNGYEVLSAVDRMACSVNAIIIAFAECLVLILRGGNIGRAPLYLCLAATGALAVTSLCGARFGFSLIARACAYALAGFVALFPVIWLALRKICAKSR